jgi:drug/metabolite transporter (DMT)-like permease
MPAEHDPEKWTPVFGKDHAPPKSRSSKVAAMPGSPPPPAPRISTSDWALLVALSVLWGGSFFFAKIAIAEIPPLTLALARVAIAAAILIALARASGEHLHPLLQRWASFALLGFANCALPFTLIFWGQTYIPSGLASIFNATTPIFTALIAHAVTSDEKLTPGKAAAVAMGFGGVAVMLGPDLRNGIAGDLSAQLACLAAAVSYAIAGVFGRRFRDLPPVTVAAGQLSAASVLLLPAAILIDRPWTLSPPSPAVIGALLALAALSTALAYVIYFRVLARAGATNLLLVTFLIPVSAILLGTLVLGERLAPHQLAGMAVIAAALAVMDGRPIRWLVRGRSIA